MPEPTSQFHSSDLPTDIPSAMTGFFPSGAAVHTARAPARLDVMGGIADYSGALVLQYPLALGAVAGVRRVTGGGLHVASFPPSGEEGMGVREYEFDASRFSRLRNASYEDARRILVESAPSWAAYLVGPVLVLLRERRIKLDGGLRIGLCSDAPEGKGIASSAAVETAVFAATAAALDCSVDGTEAARWCQIAENRIVGAPCGIMDQMVAAVGRSNRFLALLCQPAEIVDYPKIPEGLSVFGIDSGIRHAVSGSDYTSVRVGAFMGLRILSTLEGDPSNGPPEEDGWNGYLANVGVEAFEREFAEHLPERISGRAFLDRYGLIGDSVTRVDPDREYAVFHSTAHPIYEHARIGRFAALLPKAQDDKTARVEMGRLMFESHASYSACGLGSDGTDQLVQAVREAGVKSGLYGAKITGGGSGGTVAVLAEADAAGGVRRIAEEYRKSTGRGGAIFSGSSAGAFVKD